MVTFVTRLYQASPKWLRGFWGARLIEAFAMCLDAVADWAVYAVKARYAEWCALMLPDALATHGRNRGIVRGFEESALSYAVRLVRWFADRKRKGSLYTLMDQLAGYLTGYEAEIRCANLNGAWMVRAANGDRSYHRATPSNWAWDPHTDQWSRYWVVIMVPAALWQDEGVFAADEYFGDGGQIGSTITQEQADSLLAIIADWNPPHAKCDHLVLALDSDTFSPTAAPGSPMPTVEWETWADYDGSLNAYSTRLSTGRYCTGTQA